MAAAGADPHGPGSGLPGNNVREKCSCGNAFADCCYYAFACAFVSGRFGLMALALGAEFIPLPMNIDLYGYSFFTEYPLTMELLDPAFSMPGGMIVSRVIFLLAGIGFLVFAVWRNKSIR